MKELITTIIGSIIIWWMWLIFIRFYWKDSWKPTDNSAGTWTSINTWTNTWNIVINSWVNTTWDTATYRFFSWEQSVLLISWNFTVIWWKTDRLEKQYPKIKINSSNIGNAILRVVIDFTDWFVQKNKWLVYWYSVKYENWVTIKTPAPGYRFALKFWFWRIINWDVQYWWWYNVANYWISPNNKYNNNQDLWLSSAFQWQDIIWWKEYIIYLDETVVGNSNRKTQNDWIIKSIYPLDFLKKNIWKEITVSSWLSEAWIWGTKIKEMEIIYSWEKDAITQF